MLLSQALSEYIKKHPIYDRIRFSYDKKDEQERLHPLYIASRYIIDKFLFLGKKRIAIVLPDNECNILPMAIADYFDKVQTEEGYAGSVLDEVKPGQHLMLNGAVAEFCGIDEELQKITLQVVEKKVQTTITVPINGVHYLLEKTEKAISSFKRWNEAYNAEKATLSENAGLFGTLKTKRTALKKSILLLTAKIDFRDYMDKLLVNGETVEDIMAIGELDDNGFKLYNKGKLGCMPAIAAVSKTEELVDFLSNKNLSDHVSVIFSTMNKFNEIIENPDNLMRILKVGKPIVLFVSESYFKDLQMLSEYGFSIWHWKPSTMKSEALLTENPTGKIFDKLSNKINNATFSTFESKSTKNKDLRMILYKINTLAHRDIAGDRDFGRVIRKMWALFNTLTQLICPVNDAITEKLKKEFNDINDIWKEQKKYYVGQEIEKLAEDILLAFKTILDKKSLNKFTILKEYLSDQCVNKNIMVLISDKYNFLQETRQTFKALFNDKVSILTLSEFYKMQDDKFSQVEKLVVTWFDKDEYIRIKQTYCYNSMVYVLYDYENKWRGKYVVEFNECLPHDIVKKAADEINISASDILDRPFDLVDSDPDEGLEEISDYNLSREIVRSTLCINSSKADSIDVVESKPVLLYGDKIIYFCPGHDVIDVTGLLFGNYNRPVKKDISLLRKGDKILIRSSGKDIIREKADELMKAKGQSILRDLAQLWVDIFNICTADKTYDELCNELALHGAPGCNYQCIRNWIYGETIMPRNRNVLRAIGELALNAEGAKETVEQYLSMIDKIYEAGKEVQSFHQKAGRILTTELRNNSESIKRIASAPDAHGTIDQIGEIYIYTVEDILDKEYVKYSRLNTVEDLY